MDGTRTDKAEVIAYALKQIPAEYSNKKVLMVGDRSHDIIGAKKTESIAPVYYLVTAVEKNWKRPELTLLLTQLKQLKTLFFW